MTNPTCSATPQTFTLLRHGQSTWNAASKIQGSSNFSQLTERGREQARQSAQHLVSLGWSDAIDAVWSSPLTRARQTADIVVPSLSIAQSGSAYEYKIHDALREIDLYAFQGLQKDAVPDEYRNAYAAWKASPAEFEIDGHRPVVELWDRAAAAWQNLRADGHKHNSRSALVVAHNATNQALLCTAMGLPPAFFRKVVQTNAAVSRLTFLGGASDAVAVKCINRTSNHVFGSEDGDDLVVVSCGELKLDKGAREEAFGSRATVIEADAGTCDAIMKERLHVTRANVAFESDQGGLSVFRGDCLLCFNCSLKT